MNTRYRFTPWLMWLFPLLFFAFQFVLRLFPGICMPELMSKYQITAKDFGLFASLYYLGYAGLQIPIALLLERYGPRLIIGLSALLCALASVMTAWTDQWSVVLMSRFLIGAGSIVGFIGTSKVIAHWFAPEKYARMVGLTFSFGLLGAVYGGKPISLLIESMGWSEVLQILGLVSFLIALAILLFLRADHKSEQTTIQFVPAMKTILSKRALLLLALGNLLMVGVLEGFADVWGVTYLMTAKGLSKPEAASIMTYVFIGMLFGGPFLAFCAEKVKSDHLITALAGVFMAAILTYFLLFNGSMNLLAIKAMMLCLGLLCCYQVLVFTIGSKLVPPQLLSLTIAFLNCVNMLGGSFFHSLIGKLMDRFAAGVLVNGLPHYSLETFNCTLAIIPVCAIIGALLIGWSQKVMMNYQQTALPTNPEVFKI